MISIKSIIILSIKVMIRTTNSQQVLENNICIVRRIFLCKYASFHTALLRTVPYRMIIRTMCYRSQKHEIYFSLCGKNKLCNDGQPARYHPSPFFPFSFSSFFLFFYVPVILSILHHFHLLYLHFFPSFLFPFFLFFFSTF